MALTHRATHPRSSSGTADRIAETPSPAAPSRGTSLAISSSTNPLLATASKF